MSTQRHVSCGGGERAPHASASAADAAPARSARATRSDATRPRAVCASMTDARATAAFPGRSGAGSRRPTARLPGRVGGRLSTAARAQVAEDDLTNDRWETVVGLELHVQLGTATKLFRGAEATEKASGVGETTPNAGVAARRPAWALQP